MSNEKLNYNAKLKKKDKSAVDGYIRNQETALFANHTFYRNIPLIKLSKTTKTLIWAEVHELTTISEIDESMVLVCINNGDVVIIDEDDDPPTFYAFNAETFLIRDNDGDYMKDIQTSLGGFITFLTGKGNLFTYGRTKYGRCGVNNDNLDDIKQIEEYNKEEHLERLTIPYQLNNHGILSNKFITNVYLGYDTCLCLDRNKNLYCWGCNHFNILGLDQSKYPQIKDNIIWEPVLHNLFNNGKDGKIVKDVQCGSRFVCFIDNQYDCYWSPKITDVENKDNDNEMVHFQSLYDNKYEKMKIKNILLRRSTISMNDLCKLILLDIDDNLMYFEMNEELDVDKRLTKIDLGDILDKNDKIINMTLSNDTKLLFVKKKMNMS